jgi:hypothetical protein
MRTKTRLYQLSARLNWRAVMAVSSLLMFVLAGSAEDPSPF